MRAGGYVLGGEQSGHVIDLERNTTGDGPMTAGLAPLAPGSRGTTLHELAGGLRVYPQVLLNVRSHDKDVAEREASVRAAIAKAERELAGDGRMLGARVGDGARHPRHGGRQGPRNDRQIARDIADAIRSAARDSGAGGA